MMMMMMMTDERAADGEWEHAEEIQVLGGSLPHHKSLTDPKSNLGRGCKKSVTYRQSYGMASACKHVDLF
jgi:hypothetical protein